MKDKLTFSSLGSTKVSLYNATRGAGFPPGGRTGAGKSKSKGAVAHGAQHCDSAFLAERGCFCRAIAPKHIVPAPHHA